jgi:hypothetical protein
LGGSKVTITRSFWRSTFYVLNSGNVLQHRSQFAHAFIAIFTFGGDFDRFQNSVVGAFREKWIGRIGISRSCSIHRACFVSLCNASTPRNGRLPL